MRLMKQTVNAWLYFVASGPAPLFLPAQAAGSVLQRPKRANTGVFEEVLEGNLERECLEEKCDLEEVREVFEDDEKTVRFQSIVLQSDVINSFGFSGYEPVCVSDGVLGGIHR